MDKSYFIMGMNTVKEVLKAFPNRFEKVFTSNPDRKLLSEIKDKNIPVQLLSKQELTKLVQSESHQSIIAKIKPPKFLDIKKDLKLEKESQILLALDSIYDPHNFGAILRASECFGANGVIWSKNRGVGLTPIVSKVSCGASELVALFKVSNLAESLRFLKKHHFSIIAAELKEGSESLYTFQFPEKSVLVLGSEGKGIQPLIRKLCEHTIHIPMMGNITSLNVSQACSVILSHCSKQVDLLSS